MSQELLGVILVAGLPHSAMQLVVVAAMLVLVLMLVAMGTYAYKNIRGDGIEWPDDKREEGGDSDELRRASDDDEWDYY